MKILLSLMASAPDMLSPRVLFITELMSLQLTGEFSSMQRASSAGFNSSAPF